MIGLVAAIGFHISGIMPMTYVGFDWTGLLSAALIGFVAIFIQASSEELLFRGYLTQFVRRFTANKILFIGIPAIFFALPHIINIPKLGGTLWAMAPYLIMGVLLPSSFSALIGLLSNIDSTTCAMKRRRSPNVN